MKKLNIVVVGTLASDPYAGMAWMHMQIVVGLLRLGHNVYYLETTSTWPYNPEKGMRVDNPDYAVPYLKSVAEKFGIGERWAYRCSFSVNKEWFGLNKNKAEDLLANADFVFNISAATLFAQEELKVGRLVYFGTDPVYHEIKYEQGDENVIKIIDEHSDIVTYAENIGNADCLLPPLPRLRAKTRQPILMDMWQSGEPTKNVFTTVGNYRQSGRDILYKGETYYWSKHHEYLKFISLPKIINQPIELATNLNVPEKLIHGSGTEVPAYGVAAKDYNHLISNGWQLIDGPSLTTNPWTYRDYVIASYGEFSFAKDQNIRLRSGWFSERSACYLAAGRPVITQDTAFDCAIPTGVGLYSFKTMDDIIIAFENIKSDYRKNSSAARELAEEYFKAERVLQKLLKDLGA